jgi:hypothetical protein
MGGDTHMRNSWCMVSNGLLLMCASLERLVLLLWRFLVVPERCPSCWWLGASSAFGLVIIVGRSSINLQYDSLCRVGSFLIF